MASAGARSRRLRALRERALTAMSSETLAVVAGVLERVAPDAMRRLLDDVRDELLARELRSLADDVGEAVVFESVVGDA